MSQKIIEYCEIYVVSGKEACWVTELNLLFFFFFFLLLSFLDCRQTQFLDRKSKLCKRTMMN